MPVFQHVPGQDMCSFLVSYKPLVLAVSLLWSLRGKLLFLVKRPLWVFNRMSVKRWFGEGAVEKGSHYITPLASNSWQAFFCLLNVGFAGVVAMPISKWFLREQTSERIENSQEQSPGCCVNCLFYESSVLPCLMRQRSTWQFCLSEGTSVRWRNPRESLRRDRVGEAFRLLPQLKVRRVPALFFGVFSESQHSYTKSFWHSAMRWLSFMLLLGKSGNGFFFFQMLRGENCWESKAIHFP